MILKVVLGFTIILLSGVIGSKISEKYKFRKDVYCELSNFCNLLKSDLNYTFITMDKYLDSLPEILLGLINNRNFIMTGEQLHIVNNKLSSDEIVEIERFFNELGRFDIEGQNKMIDHYYKKFQYKYNEETEVYKKRSKFYIKMSALIGVLIFIIIV